MVVSNTMGSPRAFTFPWVPGKESININPFPHIFSLPIYLCPDPNPPDQLAFYEVLLFKETALGAVFDWSLSKQQMIGQSYVN